MSKSPPRAAPLKPEHANKMNSNVEPSQFRKLLTRQEVQHLVTRVLDCKAEVCDFSLQPYSVGKLGYLGSHLRLSVEVRTDIGKKELCFFAKTVPYDVPTQAEYVIKKGVFDQETAFYREIVPQLWAGYEDEPWAPTCYIVKEDLIVIEDLRPKGYTIRNKLFTKELVAAGLATIARLHASSLLAEAKLGKSFKTLYPHVFEEKEFCQDKLSRKWFDVGVDAAVAIAENLGLDTTLIAAACENIFCAMKPSPTKRNVISHGDLWANNLMFNNDVPPKCLLVDFQLLRYSPLAHDVAQLLYLCTDRKFREVWEEMMLKHYYTVLCRTVKLSGVKVEVPKWSELMQGMEEQRLGALVTAILYFPTVLMDETLAANVMNDPVDFDRYAFQNRTEIVMENMKKDLDYGRRIAEAVAELVQLTSRLDELPKPT